MHKQVHFRPKALLANLQRCQKAHSCNRAANSVRVPCTNMWEKNRKKSSSVLAAGLAEVEPLALEQDAIRIPEHALHQPLPGVEEGGRCC
jgi:hypothetical protein